MSKANEALDKMAENARELGLDYEPAQEKDQSVMYTYPSKPEPIPCGKPIGILMKRKGDEHMKLYPLAEQPAQQEPVAFFDPQSKGFYWAKPTKVIPPVTVDVEPLPLYTSPPAQRKPLTDEEIIKCWGQVSGTRYGYVAFARAIEAAHGIKEQP